MSKNGLNDKDYKTIVAQIVKEVYEDGLQPAVKETGKTLGLVPRLIRSLLLPLENWILNREYSLRITEKLLEYKLNNYKPEEMENDLKAFVAVPAINALSYSIGDIDLLNMYANLLATSMLKEDKWKIHPSFVEIIKQLSPDEARLLQVIATMPCDNEYPLINLVMLKEDKDDEFSLTISSTKYYVLKNFTSLGEEVCEVFGNISSYIENLARFNIIEINNDLTATKNNYLEIEKHRFVEEAKRNNALREGFHWECERFMFMITNFGRNFISACVFGPKKKES